MSNFYLQHNSPDHSHRCYIFPDEKLQLPCTVDHVGYHRVSTHDYSWHGLKRGNTPKALIQYTIRGRGGLEYQGRTYNLLPGQAMLLTLPENHRYFLPSDSNFYEVIYLSLEGKTSIEMLQTIRNRFGVVVSLKKNSPPVLAMHQILNNPDFTIYSLSAQAYRFLVSLYEELEKNSRPQERPAFIDTCLDYCRKHLGDNLPVEELARISSLSRFHFSREIRKWLGQSPGELICGLRMKFALELLLNSQLSVKEIASECGFSDVSYFIKVFRKHHRFTPGSARNRKQEPSPSEPREE